METTAIKMVPFGALTAKYVHYVDFSQFDANRDGFITKEELQELLPQNIFDTLNLSTIDKDADQKVTHDEYKLWQQEQEISVFLEQMKTQAAKELLGQDEEDILKLMNALEDYKDTYISDYLKKFEVDKLAKSFKQAFPAKYVEIKNYTLNNTKSAIKARVISNVMQMGREDSIQDGSLIIGIMNKSNYLSDNAQRILGNILSKESDKFIKKYEGENLEEDLTKYLLSYLASSDKDKLSDAINIWENSKENLQNLSSDVAMKKLKDSAKQLLLSAIEKDIVIKLGGTYIRTEVAISPALAKYANVDELLAAIDSIINELSAISKLEQIKSDADEKNNFDNESDIDIMNIEPKGKNIFSL